MDIHGLSSSSATNSAIIHSDNTGAIQSKLRTLLSMKVQTSGILILIACILTGCGKSMKDVAGVYETAEIKEPQSSATYYSTTWVLDLAESGTFTLKENRLRKSIVKTREPVPMKGGKKISGEWSLNHGRITTTSAPSVFYDFSGFDEIQSEYQQDSQSQRRDGGDIIDKLAAEEKIAERMEVKIPFAIQSTGDLIVVGNSVNGEFDAELYFLNIDYDIKGLRFKRVE